MEPPYVIILLAVFHPVFVLINSSIHRTVTPISLHRPQVPSLFPSSDIILSTLLRLRTESPPVPLQPDSAGLVQKETPHNFSGYPGTVHNPEGSNTHQRLLPVSPSWAVGVRGSPTGIGDYPNPFFLLQRQTEQTLHQYLWTQSLRCNMIPQSYPATTIPVPSTCAPILGLNASLLSIHTTPQENSKLKRSQERDNQQPTERPSQKRKRITAEHMSLLEAIFDQNPLPPRKTKERIANELGLSVRRVQVWFQNRRAKKRRQLRDQGINDAEVLPNPWAK
jgi:hypothetical protein